MSNRRPLLIVVVVVVALCACLACALVAVAAFLYPQRPIIGVSEGEFAGHYTSGFEVASFAPCAGSGPSGPWWLNAAPEIRFYEQYSALLGGTPQPPGAYASVFLRFRGTLSPPGDYGHLGAYEREVMVVEVVEMSVEGEC